MRTFIVGSRGSQLALCQTRQVIDLLVRLHPDVSCQVQPIKTTGDKARGMPFAGIGERGVFVREIERALVRGEVDFAVHSAKDLPSESDVSLCIAAYPEREDPSDALVSPMGGLAEMPAGARVGTSSVRRRAQLLRVRRDLTFVESCGNIDTRLRKLDSGEYDAIVLACAGLRRMGWASRIAETLSFEVCLPAAGQGALAVQCRAEDDIRGMLAALDDPPTRHCVSAERALLAGLNAGCLTPVAALAREEDGRIKLEAAVLSRDGSDMVRMMEAGSREDAEEVGRRLAERLLDSPARELLEEARRDQAGSGAV